MSIERMVLAVTTSFMENPQTWGVSPGLLRVPLSFHTRGLIQLGVVLLIATPIARVVF